MEEIKIKAYGLVHFTKKQYTITQGIVFTTLIAALVIFFVFDLSKSANIVLRNLHLVSIVIIILESIETYLMLKKFKETERTAEQAS